MTQKNKFKKFSAFVIGCGSIGERHIFNLKKLGVGSICIFDEDVQRSKILAKKYDVNYFSDLVSGLSTNPNFSVISTPPTSHLLIAKQCLSHNSHIFLEKPISHDLKSVKTFLKKADSKNIKIGVGYNFRFNPGLHVIKKFLKNINSSILISSVVGNHIKNWRPNTDYKNHYILKKGGGIILDASHEYDFVRWLLNDKVVSVYCQSLKIPNLSKHTEGIATLLLKFKKGAIANFILDFARPSYIRNTKIIGENLEITWNFKSLSQSWKSYDSISQTDVAIDKNNKIKKTSFSQPTNNMYISELQNFISSIITNSKPETDGWDSLETLKIGIAALESSKKNKLIHL